MKKIIFDRLKEEAEKEGYTFTLEGLELVKAVADLIDTTYAKGYKKGYCAGYAAAKSGKCVEFDRNI